MQIATLKQAAREQEDRVRHVEQQTKAANEKIFELTHLLQVRCPHHRAAI